MAEEEVIEGEQTAIEAAGNPREDVKSRINQLSQKLSEKSKAEEAAKAEALATARERDFYKNINPLLKEFPDAAEFQDEIKEKVNKGYDVKDATIAVLHGKSKLNAPTKQVEREMVAGGSATTNVQAGAGKSIEDLVKGGAQSDRRAKLKELLG